MEAGVRVMWPEAKEAKECHQPPKAEEARQDFPTEPLEGVKPHGQGAWDSWPPGL